MILRSVYKLWRFLFRSLVTVAVLFIGAGILLTTILQLPATKQYLRNEITVAFNDQFGGTLEIEEIRGFLPFSTSFRNGRVYSPADSLQPVIRFENAYVSIRWWEMLRRNLTINSFVLESPQFLINTEENSTNIALAFQQRSADRDRNEPLRALRFLQRVDLFAPSLQVISGSAEIGEGLNLPEFPGLSPGFQINDINLTVYLEIRDSQLFFDLPAFQASLPGTPYNYLHLSGQFYNDQRYLELNRFEISTGLFQADFSFEASPVDLRGGNLNQQFREASYSAEISESSFSSGWIRQFFPQFPEFDQPVNLEMDTDGTLDLFYINKLQANIGTSSLLFSAELRDIPNESFSYQVSLDNIVISPEKFEWIADNYFQQPDLLNPYQLSTVRGSLYGNRSGLTTSFRAETESGSLSLDGSLGLSGRTDYSFGMQVDALDISPMMSDPDAESIIQGFISVEGDGFGEEAAFESFIDLSRSSLLDVRFESFVAEIDYSENNLRFDIQGNDSIFNIAANGRYSRNGSHRHLVSDGEVNGFDITNIFKSFQADHTSFNSSFSLNISGTETSDVAGRASFEIRESLIDGEILPAHQFYADISNRENGLRQLRITSSFLDAEVNGHLDQQKISSAYHYWNTHLLSKIESELLFEQNFFNSSHITSPSADPKMSPLSLSLQFNVKDLSLLRRYLPELPDLQSSASATVELNASHEQLLITGSYSDRFFRFGEIGGSQISSAFTGIFRSDQRLREFSTFDLQISAESASFNGEELENSSVNLSMRNDAAEIRQVFRRMNHDLTLSSVISATVHENSVQFSLHDFQLSGSTYEWKNEGVPSMTYFSDKSIAIESLLLKSGNEVVEINGTFSDLPDEAVNYSIRNLNLNSISDIIGGRVTFSGTLNGEFTTRTLSLTPVIEGELEVEEGRLMERLIGDISLLSRFDPIGEKFDTEIHIFTNPEKYPRYIRNNNGIGQDIFLTGYFRLPDDEIGTEEDLVYFDADFKEIDMWIVTVIIPNIIQELEGNANGTGFFRAGRNHLDFDSSFIVDDVIGKPLFTEVEYTLGGNVQFSYNEGVILRDVRLRDSRNGTGLLYGSIDLHRFTGLTTLDLTLDLNDLHFMNNSFDPDIPFYGSIFGTGQAQIVGPTTAPLLRTTRPLSISSESRISIPLQPEVAFEQDRRFIRFVDSFEELSWSSLLPESRQATGNGDDNETLTFLQLFTMDLQFQANDPLNVRLIFDPVTNDILSTSGTGQIRILLEDQDVSMFGRFNIDGGNYQFVSGDVFTRRFTLEEGGTISWSGDLIDAALNVTAVYRARPNVSTLLSGSGSAGFIDPSQRIPVELVLQIGGTINSVENEFFFRLPTGVEGTADPTIASQISNLNQNDDEKLIQATSILLSGNFIPSSQAQGLGLAEGLSGTAIVVNPLLTSQVINPLLSNQINSLLRSDITFDIDVNLTTANEVDLGVALRLFDDRIVLRREGQITGEQSDIGDLGATYRINRTFSVNAFHRQDPTLSYTSGLETRQSQEMNGVGVEARVQFNTWNNLRERISGAFRSLFGIRNEEDSEVPLAEN
ncbi:MAG: hypothetical protein EA360_00115 [Balneolaceae bacterium]|nr:MAG: hypothetical protein EA360_00115 [Balneolaceae bacterium]